jgi:hypothetical protein
LSAGQAEPADAEARIALDLGGPRLEIEGVRERARAVQRAGARR